MTGNNLFNEDGLALSGGYQSTMDQVVMPYLKDRERAVTLSGAQDKPLHCVVYEAEKPKGSVVLVHGFTESALKFSELIYSLLQNDFSVLAYDQRGHGLSWRDGRLEGTDLTHVDRFGEYVDDLEAVCDKLLVTLPRPYSIFCHSMGGAVTALFLERRQDVFLSAVMSSPMIAPRRYNMPLWIIEGICLCAKAMGRGWKLPFIAHHYSGHEDFETSVAAGKERFLWYDDIKYTHREYQNSAPTYSWTLEAMKVTGAILKPGAVERISARVSVYTAENDASVLPEAQEAFASRLKNGRRSVVKGAKHEIYRSPDDVLFPWWHDVLNELTVQP